MSYVESSILINGNIDKIYNLAKNMEEFPKFMRDVESVKTLERTPNRTITEWVTNVDGMTISWKEEDIFDNENKTIFYRLTQGDLDKFEGSWKFETVEDKTKVTLSVDYDFGVPSLTELIGPTLELKVKENSEMMLNGIKEKIEDKK